MGIVVRPGAWASGVLVLALAVGAAAQSLTQHADTAHYRLTLVMGPVERMYTTEEVATMHPRTGEVMTGGMMAMGGEMGTSMAMDMRHLEVHVLSRATGAVVTTARCQITILDRRAGKRTEVPVATMHGVAEGPKDWHYGNNVSMPPGAYDVTVVVNGERATFHVTIPRP